MPNRDDMMRLEAERLAGARGGEALFADLSFSLANGEALVVTGRNGAGKSTLLRVLCGLLPPAAGRVFLTGAGPYEGGVAARCHYLGHRNAMKDALGIGENLAFWQGFLGRPLLTPDAALEAVGLGGLAHLPFGILSTGQKRRAAAARLLVSHRPVWLLDEPTAGLDDAARAQFAALMQAHLEDGGIVVAATHLPLGLRGAQMLEIGRAG